jgi:hypothetical protein
MRMVEAKVIKRFLLALLTLVCLVTEPGASELFKTYGEIKAGAEATRAFESHQIVPNYRYYISGSELYPNALIGVDKAYTLSGDLWKEVEATPVKFKDIVENMKSKGLEVGESLHGFDMVDPAGKKIGLWYSILRARTSIKVVGENTVTIFTPPLNVWEQRDNDRLFRGLPR